MNNLSQTMTIRMAPATHRAIKGLAKLSRMGIGEYIRAVLDSAAAGKIRVDRSIHKS